MPTLSDMIDEVRSSLAGYTLRQDRITYLNNAISSTDTAMVIGSSSNLAKGIIEIDDELIWIDNFSQASSTLNAAPGFGRGYQNTNASPHAQYAQITLTPTFPRVMIKKAINDVINSLYPKLWSVASTTFTFNASQTTYPLPDDAESILYMSWQTTGSSLEWLPINRWRADPMANVAAFNTQNTVNIYENIQPGRTVQVWYTTTPNTLEYSANIFITEEMPKAAIAPYIPSAIATPIPTIKPAEKPNSRVLFMQNIPIGPIGAAIENPIIKALIKIDIV